VRRQLASRSSRDSQRVTAPRVRQLRLLTISLPATLSPSSR
jgi:hypothetical protein